MKHLTLNLPPSSSPLPLPYMRYRVCCRKITQNTIAPDFGEFSMAHPVQNFVHWVPRRTLVMEKIDTGNVR